ncbi:reprolysin-like metallopeptidase [Dyella koreensis]|uniref:Peptidase M12B domain-containing protein n=1 Tax=Dyella koreensis TaxID=311235 RepID=A0ABW8K928_9GAMM
MIKAIACDKLALKLVAVAGGVLACSCVLAVEGPRNKASIGSLSANKYSLEGRSNPLIIHLDYFSLHNRLLNRKDSHGGGNQSMKLRLPLPEGGDTEFVLSDSGVLPPGLAKKYPQIRSLKGRDSKGREARVDLSDNGLNVAVYDLDGMWFIRPLKMNHGVAVDKNTYISTRTSDTSAATVSLYASWMRGDGAGMPASTARDEAIHRAQGYDNSLRNYRLAIAATSGYSKYVGQSLANSLASVVQVVNRSNAVFERDVGIHFTLVEDNDKIIFTDPTSDPYVPRTDEEKENDSFVRRKNTETLSKVIGIENFDAGHVFTDGIDGNGMPACQSDTKADSATGLQDLTGAPTYGEGFILTVTHELGHQFGADHIFNGCVRDGKAAVEPGSGSSVMSYAGGCFFLDKYPPEVNVLHELQDHRDSYFNGVNIAQIRQFVSSGVGLQCGSRTVNPNAPPSIRIKYGDRQIFIPAHTPFALSGSAHSENRNAKLTYSWEQIDVGPEQLGDEVLVDKGQGPIFRSFPPSARGTRVFPELEAVLGTRDLGLGEVYPSTTRELNFRLTVRDNLEGQSSTSYRDQKIHVQDTGEAFAVTYPTGATVWRGGDKKLVKWNVAGTADTPILCRDVRVDLSIDGGRVYLLQPLLASTPNTGSAAIRVPDWLQKTSRARIRVSCNDNVFFAVSDGDFKLL